MCRGGIWWHHDHVGNTTSSASPWRDHIGPTDKKWLIRYQLTVRSRRLRPLLIANFFPHTSLLFLRSPTGSVARIRATNVSYHLMTRRDGRERWKSISHDSNPRQSSCTRLGPFGHYWQTYRAAADCLHRETRSAFWAQLFVRPKWFPVTRAHCSTYKCLAWNNLFFDW